jgi:hypothetical protein
MFSQGTLFGAAAFLSLLLMGCASTPRPAEDLARAKSLVQQAEAGNVQRYAAVELNQARDKLQAAERADSEENFDAARRRANEAAADAELASALARSREVEQATAEQQKSLDALRQQITRGDPLPKADTSGDTP